VLRARASEGWAGPVHFFGGARCAAPPCVGAGGLLRKRAGAGVRMGFAHPSFSAQWYTQVAHRIWGGSEGMRGLLCRQKKKGWEGRFAGSVRPARGVYKTRQDKGRCNKKKNRLERRVWRSHQLWVRGYHVRAEPARAGPVFFGGGALRCLADGDKPLPKNIARSCLGAARPRCLVAQGVPLSEGNRGAGSTGSHTYACELPMLGYVRQSSTAHKKYFFLTRL
jgi:hypothetical protein